MKAIVKTAIVAGAMALVSGLTAASSTWAQQPSGTPAPQATPPAAQPGPGTGMEHGKGGHDMGKQMEQKGHQQGGQHAPMGPGMMQQPSQGAAPK